MIEWLRHLREETYFFQKLGLHIRMIMHIAFITVHIIAFWWIPFAVINGTSPANEYLLMPLGVGNFGLILLNWSILKDIFRDWRVL